LVVDADKDLRFLFVRKLVREFPGCTVMETEDPEDALRRVKLQEYDAIFVHRAIGADAVTVIRNIREERPSVQLIAVSTIDRSAEVLAAGANAFYDFDQWHLIGPKLAAVLC